MVDLIEELKGTLKMEMRSDSEEKEYLEAGLETEGLKRLNSLLRKHLGPAVKECGEEAYLPEEIQELVDSLGGLRNEQSFFFKQEAHQIIYAAIWPWQSNPDKITLKSGISERSSED